jgi:hypothetical protein
MRLTTLDPDAISRQLYVCGGAVFCWFFKAPTQSTRMHLSIYCPVACVSLWLVVALISLPWYLHYTYPTNAEDTRGWLGRGDVTSMVGEARRWWRQQRQWLCGWMEEAGVGRRCMVVWRVMSLSSHPSIGFEWWVRWMLVVSMGRVYLEAPQDRIDRS